MPWRFMVSSFRFLVSSNQHSAFSEADVLLETHLLKPSNDPSRLNAAAQSLRRTAAFSSVPGGQSPGFPSCLRHQRLKFGHGHGKSLREQVSINILVSHR